MTVNTNTKTIGDDDKIQNNINIKIDLADLKKKKKKPKRKAPSKPLIQGEPQGSSTQASRPLNKGLTYKPSSSTMPTIQELSSILRFRPYIENLGTQPPLLPYVLGFPIPSLPAPPTAPTTLALPAPGTATATRLALPPPPPTLALARGPTPPPTPPRTAPRTIPITSIRPPTTASAPSLVPSLVVRRGRPPVARLVTPASLTPASLTPASLGLSEIPFGFGGGGVTPSLTPASLTEIPLEGGTGPVSSSSSSSASSSSSSLATLSSLGAGSVPLTPSRGAIDIDVLQRRLKQSIINDIRRRVSADEISKLVETYNTTAREEGLTEIPLSEFYREATAITTPTVASLMRLERERERERLSTSTAVEPATGPVMGPPRLVLESGLTGGLTGRSIYSSESESETGGITSRTTGGITGTTGGITGTTTGATGTAGTLERLSRPTTATTARKRVNLSKPTIRRPPG